MDPGYFVVQPCGEFEGMQCALQVGIFSDHAFHQIGNFLCLRRNPPRTSDADLAEGIDPIVLALAIIGVAALAAMLMERTGRK